MDTSCDEEGARAVLVVHLIFRISNEKVFRVSPFPVHLAGESGQ